MAETLQIGRFTFASSEIVPLLAGYQMLPQLLREMIIDEAIASIECSDAEILSAVQQFCERNQLNSAEKTQAWQEFHGMTAEQLHSLAIRGLKVEKFKQATWGNKLESYFLSRKGQLDKVYYSLIRTQELEIAQELFFRLQESEQSFAELAREYSQGPEAQTGGIIGPLEMSAVHPNLAKMLSVTQPGKICPPMRVGEWIVIVRLEKLIPASLDELTRQRLLNELFATWLQEQLQKVGSIRAPLTQLAAS